MNLFSLVYIGQFRIIKDRIEKNLELFNQFLCCLAGIHLTIFSDWISDQNVKYLAGWSYISCLILMSTINYIFIIYYASL